MLSGQGKTVLLLGGDDQETKTIGRYLAKLRFALAYAASATEAIHALRSAEIHIAIIDNSLNEIAQGGERELVTCLRNSAKNPKLPIILLSPKAFSFDIEQYLRAGVDKCIAKPVELQTLARVCSEVTK